uniref:Uncharacterized protein n=1 Tax=Micrurus corallinus TaxID=54390 RepID=A0A2D4F3P2_MICCO
MLRCKNKILSPPDQPAIPIINLFSFFPPSRFPLTGSAAGQPEEVAMEKPSVFWRHLHTWHQCFLFLPSFNLLRQMSLIFILGIKSQLQNANETLQTLRVQSTRRG